MTDTPRPPLEGEGAVRGNCDARHFQTVRFIGHPEISTCVNWKPLDLPAEAKRLSSELAATREERDRLQAVTAHVPRLLRWMDRHHGGDPSLDSEEFYVEKEEAERLLAALDASQKEEG